MKAETIDALGIEIVAAERAATPLRPLSKRYPDLDPATAYRIQERYAKIRGATGATLIGRKIGCTSAAIQELFGIDTPDYGHIFDDMVVAEADVIDVAQLIVPMVEPEITFVLDRGLQGPGVTSDDVLAATRAVLPSLEIIDSRIAKWDIEFVDTVADNGSSARCVFGPEGDAAIDLGAESVRLLQDGQELCHGVGAAVLGHPAASVAWLANVLADYGRALRAGDYVLSGSMTRAVPAVVGCTYEARFDTLGTVSCRFR